MTIEEIGLLAIREDDLRRSAESARVEEINGTLGFAGRRAREAEHLEATRALRAAIATFEVTA